MGMIFSYDKSVSLLQNCNLSPGAMGERESERDPPIMLVKLRRVGNPLGGAVRRTGITDLTPGDFARGSYSYKSAETEAGFRI
jgi:hypothetical protein